MSFFLKRKKKLTYILAYIVKGFDEDTIKRVVLVFDKWVDKTQSYYGYDVSVDDKSMHNKNTYEMVLIDLYDR